LRLTACRRQLTSIACLASSRLRSLRLRSASTSLAAGQLASMKLTRRLRPDLSIVPFPPSVRPESVALLDTMPTSLPLPSRGVKGAPALELSPVVPD
jgi:hypothetical protein